MRQFLFFSFLCFAFNAALAQSPISFIDVADTKSIDYAGKSFGSTWGDINGDGLIDLFMSCHANGGDLYNVTDVPVIYYNNGDSFTPDFILNGEGPNMATGTDWHGSAFFDVDRDGDLDMLNSLGGNSDNTFYLNNNGLEITDVSDAFNLSSPMSSGRTPGLLDVNGDGYTDVITNGVASAGGPPKLLLNNEGTSFTEANEEYNIDWTTSVFSTSTDLNNDGSLDLLSLTWKTRHQLLGENGFSSTQDVGANKVLDFVVADLNNDLLPDIFNVRGNRGVYVEQMNDNLVRANVNLFLPLDPVDFRVQSSSEEIEIKIYPRSPSDSYVVVVGDEFMPTMTGEITTLNLNSTSQNVIRTVDVEFPEITPRFYIAYDPVTDQWEVLSKSGTTNKRPFGIDVLGTDLVLEDNYPVEQNWGGELFYNQGERVFQKEQTSVFDDNDNLRAVVAADFDNDMDLDLYAVRSNYASNKQNILWENMGGGNWIRHEGAWGAHGNGPGLGENVTTVDYNNDGFMDLFVTNGLSIYWLDSARTNLYENQGNENNWLKVQLKGIASDPMGLNAKVVVTAGGISQMRYQNGGTHRFSQNDPRLHFGLAGNETVETVEVFWPSGIHQTLNNVSANQILTIEEEAPCENPYPMAENLSAEILPNGVLLTWDPIPGSFNCQVNGGKTTNSWNVSYLTNEENSSSFFVPQGSLQWGAEYRWRVRCACTFQIRGPFPPFQFFTWGAPNIEGLPSFGDASIFPNPVGNEDLNVHLDRLSGTVTASFFDVQGRMVKQETIVASDNQLVRFDVTEFESGVYLLQLANTENVESHKFVKE
jgi:hypothetical protein